ncbi:hypothetical protein Tco_0715861 [Tanacetum coccineum]
MHEQLLMPIFLMDVIKRVMRPLALRQTRRPRSDRGKARHFVSSTSAYHNHGYSSHQGDDDEDDGASRASTPSPTTYLKSLKPLDYQQYEVPTSSEQNDDLLFELIIMVQPTTMQTDVHLDDCVSKTRDMIIMDANKKVDFEQVQCPPERKILMNIIKDHPLKFMLDKKMLSLTLDDFRTIFHLPQATDNNHDSFVPPPSFLDMVPFYKNELGFTNGVKTSLSFTTQLDISAAMANVVQDIFQMLDNTHNWMGSTTIANNENDVLLY